jgi:hypothetical protein
MMLSQVKYLIFWISLANSKQLKGLISFLRQFSLLYFVFFKRIYWLLVEVGSLIWYLHWEQVWHVDVSPTDVTPAHSMVSYLI